MATGARVVGATTLILLLCGGAYLTADAHDVVPGPLTLEPVQSPPPPFPTAPGAVEAPDPDPALADLDPQAPVPTAAKIQPLVNALASDERLGSAKHVGIVVSDQLTGDVLGSHLPDDGRTPASNAKLVTAVGALSALPGDTTLPTRVVRGSADQIVLVGGGDMMLGSDRGDDDAVLGHAGIGDLARATAKKLKLAGTTSVSLGFDDSLFTGPTLSPGWDDNDIAAGYVAPVTALAVNIAATRPFQGIEDYPPRYPDPSAAAARTFAQRLEAAGITVQGTPTRITAPSGAQQLAVVRSAPLEQIVHFFLDTSDNTITEVVSRLVAIQAELPASFGGGTQAVLRAVQLAGVDTKGAHLADASGLGYDSKLPARVLADLVKLSTDPAHPELRSVAIGMPIAGLTGTLTDRFTLSPARGYLRAKTGSLKHVTALSGTILDSEGRQLVFSVIADGTPDGGQWAPRQAIDAFATTLSRCGCR
ncbi:D-alanyl-D-alanine carboxypeptidase/D-alanyl-D-alanine-endopeptidase [Cellulomonas sp. JH27-2]|uniref:D-alanyl-D-alanine carboxypeptidase/D-alanyl-D-alanine endopeptidase n=1 Tax=Cellulomonas sp. JH27-2 TaxID=2774139 RepID=UPI00177E7166|nr:D-alanyl-D-alanine carboxypeptidase/D-alanyl-D-alanine-endopeptidase [Cellulomonas sp. JH27-2]MBD8059392.1 D-alanyl-D-alanine carboxypeptidase/D-alanyl-D-alanine-endopeptidase [Cellulomonas sp. JH27-2]